jgi:hypothetical protein
MSANQSTVSTPAVAPTILRKHFKSRGAFALFALSADAPRYSASLHHDVSPELAATFGMVAGEVLFCEDLPNLQREALRWKDNGYEVYIDKASNYPDIDCSDAWAIRAGREVPAWFLENIFQYAPGPQLTDTHAEVELQALSELCYQGAESHLHILDRAVDYDHQYLRETANDPNEYTDWLYTGFDEVS